MNALAVISNARRLVGDTDSAILPDASYLPWVNEAVSVIFKEHPESRIAAGGGTLMDYNPAGTVASPLGISEFYLVPMIDYVCFRFFDSDSADRRDADRAKQCRAAFEAWFKPV